MDDAPLFFYITAPDAAAADALGRGLVEDGCAACVNIIPGMRSVYRWEGRVESAEEHILIAKSTRNAADALKRKVAALHPYETPCVVALPLDAGASAENFIDWIVTQTRGAVAAPPGNAK
ncbi:MAG: divalent-cation tolerance protein CutA [Pseudomonadota bacterium]